MWIKRLGESLLDDPVPDESDYDYGDDLGLNGFFDRVGQYGSRLVEAANEHVLTGHIAKILAPDPPYEKPQPRRQVTIGVMGSSTEEHKELAVPLGRWIAESGFSLVTGGGQGVMCSTSRAFVSVPERTGMCLGVIPSSDDSVQPRLGYPNAFIEMPVFTQLPLVPGLDQRSRNHINVLTADVVIVLPGSSGTYSELQLALKYKKKVIVYLGDGDHEVVGMREGEAPIVRCLDDVKAFVLESLHRSVPEFQAPSHLGPVPMKMSTKRKTRSISIGVQTEPIEAQPTFDRVKSLTAIQPTDDLDPFEDFEMISYRDA